jgi:hypothetical protein
MPVICDWYDESKAIIITHFLGSWTQEEFLEGNKASNVFCSLVQHRFDIISDFTQASYTPPAGILWKWEQMVTVRDIEFPHWGLTILVASSSVLEAYFEGGREDTEAIRKHYRLVKTVTEAVQVILTDRTRIDE